MISLLLSFVIQVSKDNVFVFKASLYYSQVYQIVFTFDFLVFADNRYSKPEWRLFLRLSTYANN